MSDRYTGPNGIFYNAHLNKIFILRNRKEFMVYNFNTHRKYNRVSYTFEDGERLIHKTQITAMDRKLCPRLGGIK